MNQVTLNPVTLVYHEVRAPLGLLATAARAAAEDCEDETLRRRCETIMNAAERVLRISQQILALAATSTATQAGESFSPALLVDQIADDLRDLGMRITVTHAPGASLAQSSVPTAQFEAVLHSLLMNAADHSPDDSLISVHTSVDSTFSVSISNPIDGRRRHRGLGVGHYICEELVQAFGGELRWCADNGHYRADILVPVTSAAEAARC